ncbi:ABC transporter ATP-binding protein [Microtetraspora malaysiensis]|uniref:ABC transporter ATP-binding protein n=1 Tax=Microtetraspora malaysiensis TaxID=161358 RepID=A0ABW6T5Y0_9ACTN
MRLSAEGVELRYDRKVVARNLSLEIPDNQVSVLIGPNGSGKSTALKSLARLLRPAGGRVLLDGASIQSLPTKEIARRLAILPQVLTTPEAITVEDLIWFGRHPHRRTVGAPSPQDREMVEWALRSTDTAALRDQYVDQLSGGQRQRVWIAVCLAQQTDLLLLDEPTTFLDVTYQLELLDLLARLNGEEGKTIAMVLHDFNMAAEYADHIFVLAAGELVCQGTPREVLTKETMRTVFSLDVEIGVNPRSGRPLVIPLRRRPVSLPA